MDMMKMIEERHSVRSYKTKAIEEDIKNELLAYIEQCNKESGLHMQLVVDEPQAFEGSIAHYGHFSGVRNYIALVGVKSKDFKEKCGYYGEKVVLKAQALGLNTCWVVLTYNRNKAKKAFQIGENEKLCCVITIGYGTTQGVAHKGKTIQDLCQVQGEMPQWFENGMRAVQLAPTSMNRQKFMFILKGNKVSIKTGVGINLKLDMGIVKYHFEVGAKDAQWEWGE